MRHGGDTHRPKWPPSSIFICKSKVSPLPMSFDENRVWSIHRRPGCESLNPSGEDQDSLACGGVCHIIVTRSGALTLERRRNQPCLTQLVKAIRVRVRNSPKVSCTRPGSSFLCNRSDTRMRRARHPTTKGLVEGGKSPETWTLPNRYIAFKAWHPSRMKTGLRNHPIGRKVS